MKTKVEVELSHAQEIALMDRYGRSSLGLISYPQPNYVAAQKVLFLE